MATINGNQITVNRASGDFFNLKWYSADGNQIDISSTPLAFVVDKAWTVTPELDPQDPLARIIRIEHADILALGRNERDFALIEVGFDGPPIWTGTILAEGFAV